VAPSFLTTFLLALGVQAAAEERQASLFRALNSGRCDVVKKIIAEAPDAEALLYRAELHDIGSCASQDKSVADTLYLRAAKAGNAEAMYSVWNNMAHRVGGSNPPTDAERADALNWLFRAGELKNWRAARTLWQFYEYALYGYERDEVKAAYWKQVYEANRPVVKTP
jgi:TPR repeat protein